MPISRRFLLAGWLCLASPSAWAALALDGTASGHANNVATSVSTTTGLTTTISTDVVIALVTNYSTGTAQTVSSMSGCSLSWSKRTSTGSLPMRSGVHGDVDVWYAKAAGTTCTSSTITATLSGAPSGGESDIAVFAVSGADTVTPFDENGTLPASGNSTSTVATPALTGVSTTNANTMLYAVTLANLTSGHPGAGYTTIDVANVTPGGQDNQYKIVSSTQSSVTVSFGTGDSGFGWVMVADAIHQSSGAGGGAPFVFSAAIVP